MALYKKYPASGKMCKVTFELPAEAVKDVKSVCLVGEFNDWSSIDTPMKKQKDGSFAVTLSLAQGREYQFRYLLDGSRWENDWAADKYVPAPYSCTDNSVVIV